MAKLPKLETFEQFWKYSNAAAIQGNDVSYHPCCDSWTSRNSKKAQASHQETKKWRNIISELDCDFKERKAAMKATMSAENMKMKVVFNMICPLFVPAADMTAEPQKISNLETDFKAIYGGSYNRKLSETDCALLKDKEEGTMQDNNRLNTNK